MKPGLQKIMRALQSSPSVANMGSAVGKLVRLAQDDNSALEALIAAITSDVELARKVLAAANAPAYGQGGNVATVARAVAVLGFNAVRSLALSSLLVDRLQDPAQRESLQHAMQGEVAQSLLACALARRLVRECNCDAAEVAELAAMLRSLGRVLAATYAQLEYEDLRARSAARGVSDEDLAEDILGASFADITARALTLLDVPEPLQHAATGAVPGAAAVIAHQATALAAALSESGLRLADPRVGACVDSLSHELELRPERVVALAGSAMDEVAQVCASLKLHRRDPSQLAKASPGAASAQSTDRGLGSALAQAVAQHGAQGGAQGGGARPARTGGLAAAELEPPADMTARLDGLVQDLQAKVRAGEPFGAVLLAALEGVRLAGNYRSVLFARQGSDACRAVAAHGPASELVSQGWAAPLGSGGSVLDAAYARGVSLHLRDLGEPRVARLLPAWLGQHFAGARAVVLLPLMLGNVRAGFVLADRAVVESADMPRRTAALGEVMECLGQSLQQTLAQRVG